MSGVDDAYLNSATLDVRHDAGVTLLTLRSQDQRNRLTPECLAALSRALNAAIADPRCRAILLRSAHRDFCWGMDLALLTRTQQSDDDENDHDNPTAASAPRTTSTNAPTHLQDATDRYARLLLAIAASPKPVACVVAGEVKAGGVGLACACDIVYATPEAHFELSEVLFGLIPANVLATIFGLRLSPQKARYLILTARRLAATEACALHLVDEVFAASTMDRSLRALFKQLLRSSPDALAETKRMTREILWHTPEEISHIARIRLPQLAMQPATRAGLAAFNDGLTPEWFARYKPTQPLFNPHRDI